MIVSTKFKFIFFKPVKTAGTSIEAALEQFCGEQDLITPRSHSPHTDSDSLPHLPRNYAGFYNHIPPALAKNQLEPWLWDEYFKFTVVRNPWDLVVSSYVFNIQLVEANQEFHNQKISKKANIPLKEWLENFAHKRLNLGFYFDSIGMPYFDFCMRYESLQSDFDSVCDKLSIPKSKLPRMKDKFRDHSVPYMEYYDNITKNMVGKLYEKEIAEFGYGF